MDEMNQQVGIDVGLSTKSTRFENATRQLTQDLSLKQISQVLIQNWPLFMILFCVFSILSIAFYTVEVPFVSKGRIIINDAQNSSLQSFAHQIGGIGIGSGKTNEAKKANSSVQKYLEYLRTTDFFAKLLTQINQRSSDKSISLAEKNGYKIFVKNYVDKNPKSLPEVDQQLKIYRQLESMLSYKVVSDYELQVQVASKDKDLSLFLSNAAVAVIITELKNREAAELAKMEEFLLKQKDLTDTELQTLNKKLADFQSKPENLISLSSGNRVGEYISDLMMRKNETVMKISENNKVIGLMTSQSNGRRESQLYGNGGRTQALKIENQMLQAQLGHIQSAIDRITNQAKGIPFAAQMHEELKKKSEIEFNKYKDISDALSKAQAYQLSLTNKFEVLELSRIENVKPLVSLLTLLLVSLVLSQVLGSLIIYVTTIWDSSLVTAQQTRNVVVIDSHSLDPRVFIENSKIKFRLKHTEISNQTDTESDMENGHSKKLGFNIFKKAEGDDQNNETNG